MPTHISERGLHQDATLWVVSPDAFGGDTFSDPIPMKVRWEERSEEFFSLLDQNEQVSRAIVMCDRTVHVEDYLYLGISTAADPTTLVTAFKVRRFDNTPDLRNLKVVRKAFL